ncbi:MAG: homoserine dehydrogenase [Pseudomonadota bacterium]
MSDPLRLGIAGLGTVGVGVVRILRGHAAMLTARTAREIQIAAVSARSRDKDRGISLSDYPWEDDPVALAKRDDIDVFVELMGGEDGPAKAATVAALDAGKDVVTANKAMLALHGQALAEQAEAAGRALKFEAAVAGGIPIIKTLTEGLAGNVTTRVMGVMNGSCNYILTRMENSGKTYQEIFDEAEGLGYLEADPKLDVGGIDAAHKLALLSAISFGTQVNFGGIQLEGIEQVRIEDIRAAADMGYKIKLLGVTEMTGRGLEQRMQPCLVPATAPLGQLDGGTNMVVVEGDAVGQIVLRGAGAGEGPTASAVLSDICDVARGQRGPVFGQPATSLIKSASATSQAPAPYYLRMDLIDKPGALAKIASVLGDAGVSINRMRQYQHETPEAPVLIVTHKSTHASVSQALSAMTETGVVAGIPVALRIEEI